MSKLSSWRLLDAAAAVVMSVLRASDCDAAIKAIWGNK